MKQKNEEEIKEQEFEVLKPSDEILKEWSYYIKGCSNIDFTLDELRTAYYFTIGMIFKGDYFNPVKNYKNSFIDSKSGKLRSFITTRIRENLTTGLSIIKYGYRCPVVGDSDTYKNKVNSLIAT